MLNENNDKEKPTKTDPLHTQAEPERAQLQPLFGSPTWELWLAVAFYFYILASFPHRQASDWSLPFFQASHSGFSL